MGKEFLKKTADLLQTKHKRKQWQKIMISLSLVVAMLTSILLIHPAITMERKVICGQEEHTHSNGCYEKKLICGKEEHTKTDETDTAEEHTHTDSCYEEVLTCSKQEHTHSEACYEKEEPATTEATTTVSEDTEKASDSSEEKKEEATTEEKKEEATTEAAEQTTEEAKAEARTLTAKGKDYTVQVDCPAEAKIPAEAKLVVKEIKKNSDDYEKYYKKTEEAVAKGEDTEISFARFFDISFEVDGKEIEPAAKVEVKITYNDKVEVADTGKVKSVHFDDKGKTEVLNVKTNEKNGKMDEVKFDAKSFSVYAIVGTETLTGDVLTVDGKTYTVTVTYGADAKIPAGAKLEVTEISQDSNEYQNYLKQALEAMTNDKEVEVASARFFDVSIMVDGEKYEPKAAVQVKITYNDPFSVDIGDEIKQVHFADNGIEVLDVEADQNDKGQVTDVTFNQDSFSVTGTVIVTDSDGWPTSTGYYALIVKADNNSKSDYYAVKKDGSLIEVSYDVSTGKVSFPTISESDDLLEYEWEYSKSSNSRYLKNGSSYIDPSNASGISSSSCKLSISNNYIKQNSLNYFLAFNPDTLKLYGRQNASDDNANNRVQVFFAKDFSADSTAGGGTSGGGEGNVDLGAPATSKILESNNDGTYKLSLSVTGKSEAKNSKSKADVLVVFDTSGSMTNTRMSTAKSAIRNLASMLLSNNTNSDPDLVRMSMITFSTNVNKTYDWTTNSNTFAGNKNSSGTYTGGYVGQISSEGNGGTNWEGALQQVASMKSSMRSEAAHYVIFVSDGNPTYHMVDEGWNDKRTDRDVYGTGMEDESYIGISGQQNVLNCYNAAKDDARALVKMGMNFYTVGVFGNPDRMSNLSAFAYSGNDIGTYPEGHYQTASDQTSLNKAFQSIINDIQKNFSYTDVTINDGITDLTSTAAINGIADGFTYSVTDANGNAVNVPDTIKTASYDADNKKVVWSLGAGYQLEDGYTYKVSFSVWPTQQAYDILAALKNGDITFEESSAKVNGNTVDWSQFIQNADGTYSLMTNTNANATYRQITTTNGVAGDPSELKTSAITAKPSMPLANTAMTVQKIWDDSSNTSSRPSKITLNITKDGVTYQSVTLSDSNEWKATIYIAPGLKVDGTILEPGHEYTVVEPGNTRYEFEAEKVHPMLINSSSQITYGGDEDAIIKAKNTLKLSVFNVELIKVDSSNQNKTLSGAEFKLYKEDGETIAINADGEVIGDLKTDNAGKVTIGKLIEGTYILRETKAPDGYNLGDDITIVVTENKVIFTQQGNQKDGTASGDGFTYTLTITNSAGQELPMTGGSGTLPYTLGGLLLMFAAALMYGFKLRRRGRRLS